MTRAIAKSDSQLDAEAAAPQRSLADTIALHRALAAADIGGLTRLHQRDGDFGIGLPFSHPFERFLDLEWAVENAHPGTIYPYATAVFQMRYKFCRPEHPEHRHREEWRGSLCAALISLCVWSDYSFGQACYELVADIERTKPVMLRALAEVEMRMKAIESKEREVAHSDQGRQDWMAPPVSYGAHGIGGIHAQECPKCRGQAA